MELKTIYWSKTKPREFNIVIKNFFDYKSKRQHQFPSCTKTDYPNVLVKAQSQMTGQLLVVQHLNGLFTVMIVAVTGCCGRQCGDVPANTTHIHLTGFNHHNMSQWHMIDVWMWLWLQQWNLTTVTAVKHCQCSETQVQPETPPPETTAPPCWSETHTHAFPILQYRYRFRIRTITMVIIGHKIKIICHHALVKFLYEYIPSSASFKSDIYDKYKPKCY